MRKPSKLSSTQVASGDEQIIHYSKSPIERGHSCIPCVWGHIYNRKMKFSFQTKAQIKPLPRSHVLVSLFFSWVGSLVIKSMNYKIRFESNLCSVPSWLCNHWEIT